MYGLICKNNCDTVRLFEGKVPVTVSEVPKTKILIWTANPKGQAWLRLENEVRAIIESWERATLRSNFEIVHQGAVSTDNLQRSLREVKPQIVHFAGHGTEVGELVLENVMSEAHRVTPDALAQLFGGLNNEDRPKCVFLNACCSSCSGLVDRIYEYIDCVIGINGQIEDSSAIAFAGGFYDALFNGNKPSNAFEAGRISLALKRMPGEPVLRNKPSTPTSTSTTQPIDTESTQNLEIIEQFYVERSADRIAMEWMRGGRSVTLTIKGLGKTKLLNRMVVAARKVGKVVADLDFQNFVNRRERENEDDFYQLFCSEVAKKLDCPYSLENFLQCGDTNPQRSTYYVQDYVLPNLWDRHLVLAIDHADRIYFTEYRSDFYCMLRSWEGLRERDPIWSNVSIIIVAEMRPLITNNGHGGSPHSSGDEISLNDFTLEEILRLNQSYGLPLGDEQLGRLHRFLNGHPYLVNVALKLVLNHQWNFDNLIERAADRNGPFSEDLNDRWTNICDTQELVQGLRHVIRRNIQSLSDDISRRLMLEGLIRMEGQEYVMRCPLYEVYFRERLRNV
jgi:hypothetical protein